MPGNESASAGVKIASIGWDAPSRTGIAAATIDEMAGFYLNSYKPLICSRPGRLACAEYSLRPLIDGSIRREPDLEHPFPSISCLCRAGKFAPRLRIGDVVGYLTNKARFGGPTSTRQLTALLRIQRRFVSHADAAQWFHDEGLALPSNCMVEGNFPNPLCKSHCIHNRHVISRSDSRSHRRWDAGYRLRAAHHPFFLVCRAVFIDVTVSAPHVTDEDLVAAFGHVPGTQNPGKLPRDQYCRFLDIIGLEVSL